MVVTNILIEHFSEGSFDENWINDTLKLYDKWKNHLPQIAGISISENEIIERTQLANQIFELKKEIIRIRNTKAFRIGKFILSLFSFLIRSE